MPTNTPNFLYASSVANSPPKMEKKSLYIRKPPLHPGNRQLNKKNYYYHESGESLLSLYEKYPDGYIEINMDEDIGSRIVVIQDETEEEYAARLEYYTLQKAIYDDWYEENKEAIREQQIKNKVREARWIQKQVEFHNNELKKGIDALEDKKAELEKLALEPKNNEKKISD